MAIVKKAAALANIDTGYLAKDIGHEIAEAAQEIVDGKFHDQFIVHLFKVEPELLLI